MELREHYLVLWASWNPQNAGPEMVEIVPEMLRKVGEGKWVMDQVDGDIVGDTAFTSFEKAVLVAKGHLKKLGIAEEDNTIESDIWVAKTVWPPEMEGDTSNL